MNIALITYPADTAPTGVGINVQNIAKNLIELDKENNYFCLHFSQNDNPIYKKNEVLYKHYPYLPVMFSDSWYLYRNSYRFDVVHRFSPGGFIFNIRSKIVITVNDLFLYKTYHFNQKLKTILARYFNRSSLMKADAIIAISRFTKREIINTFKVDSKRIHVVYCAPNIFVDNDINGWNLLQSKYGLTDNYVLFVGTIEPRKNLLNLVKAFEILKEHYSVDESLVVVGKKGWGYYRTMDYIEKSKYRHAIKLVGFVPTSHLALFYRYARLFVYPSFMEGFGIPPLEAMTCGCPTLTSNTSSLPEIMRDDEMMFDPNNIDEIVARCLPILKTPDARHDNLKKGSEIVNRFSWKESARKLIHIYNKL